MQTFFQRIKSSATKWPPRRPQITRGGWTFCWELAAIWAVSVTGKIIIHFRKGDLEFRIAFREFYSLFIAVLKNPKIKMQSVVRGFFLVFCIFKPSLPLLSIDRIPETALGGQRRSPERCDVKSCPGDSTCGKGARTRWSPRPRSPGYACFTSSRTNTPGSD